MGAAREFGERIHWLSTEHPPSLGRWGKALAFGPGAQDAARIVLWGSRTHL